MVELPRTGGVKSPLPLAMPNGEVGFPAQLDSKSLNREGLANLGPVEVHPETLPSFFPAWVLQHSPRSKSALQ